MAKVSPDAHIPLLKDESGGLMWEEGISTITFYKGGDFQTVSKSLRAQLALVVGSNPWLAGLLVKTKKGPCLRHPIKPSETDIDSLFAVYSANDISFKLKRSSPYSQICKNMYSSRKIIVGNGQALLGKNKPVAILSIVELESGYFSLIFSVSHVVADGRTYYEIFKMLQPGAPVRELNPDRIMSFSDTMRDMCGRKSMAWIDSPSTMCMFLPGMLCGKKAQCFAFYLDAERVTAAKTANIEGSNVPYVSTNDVITSAFLNEVDARIGLMGMDLRNRIDGIEEDLAGQ